MKPWIFLPLAVLVAILARGLFASNTAAGAEPASARDDRALLAELDALARELDELERTSAELAERTVTERSARAESISASPDYDDAAIRASVEAWLASHAVETQALTEGIATANGAPETAGARLSIEDLLEYFSERAPFDPEAQLMYQELRDAGRMDEFVAAVEAIAAANPEDAEAQTELGLAYLQQLFGMGTTPEAGMAALKADTAFSRALELDPTNVNARFTKAVALSNWPDFMGKTGEAIEHFEILRSQVEKAGTPDDFAQLYLFLGNMYQRVKEHEKAAEAWQAGLLFYPDDEALLEQIELSKDGDSKADG